MARDYLELLHVTAAQRSLGGTYAFELVLDGPGGQARIPIAPDALLHYPSVQMVILCATGHVWRHSACEGRPPEATSECWKSVLQVMIVHPPSQSAGPPN